MTKRVVYLASVVFCGLIVAGCASRNLHVQSELVVTESDLEQVETWLIAEREPIVVYVEKPWWQLWKSRRNKQVGIQMVMKANDGKKGVLILNKNREIVAKFVSNGSNGFAAIRVAGGDFKVGRLFQFKITILSPEIEHPASMARKDVQKLLDKMMGIEFSVVANDGNVYSVILR